MKYNEWIEKDQDGKDQVVNLTGLVNYLINNKNPNEMPRGLDKFKIFSKLVNVFEKGKENKEYVFEEEEYKFVKNLIEKDIPSQWGLNKDILGTINEFLNAKEE